MTDFQPMLVELRPVTDRFEQAGHQLFLVGGVVRDRLLGDDPVDIDLTTDARPEVTRRLIAPLAQSVWAQGERFGTIGARVANRDLEITTYRREAYVGESRKPVVEFGDDLQTDLSRRDFTINAMAVSLASGQLVDPYGGVGDLETGLLRTPLDPSISFSDDPLRILRAARFIPRFGLTATAELSAAATALSHRLSIVSAERKRDELERLLILPSPALGLAFLGEHGVFADVIPELSAQWRTAATRAQQGSTALVRRAALLMELGDDGAKSRLEALTYSRADVASTVTVLRLLPKILAADGTDRSLRMLVAAAGNGAEPALVDAALATATIIDPSVVSRVIEPLDRLRAVEDLTALDGPLSGADVMRLLDLTTGPEVGRALAVLREHRLAFGPFDERAALELLQQTDLGESRR